VETGAGVPGYSGGLAAAWWFRMRVFFVAGVADPGAARSLPRSWIRPWRRAPRRTSHRTFFESCSNASDSDPWFRIRRLRDVAWGPVVETGAGVPGYSGGLAAAWWFRMLVFFVAGVADPGAARSLPRSWIRPWRRAPRRTSHRTFFESCSNAPDSDPWFRIRCLRDVAWGASRGNRGRRTRLQRRLGRRVVVSSLDFL
jgi:anti-sigma factor RsiW